MLTDLSLPALLEELAAPHPAPGGGSALAAALALAASIVEMVARVSAGSWPEAQGAAAQAEALRERSLALVQIDADVYRRALEVRATAAELPEDRRDWEVGRVLAEAAEPPLALCRLAADVAELARTVAGGGEPAVQADAVAVAGLAAAVAHGARRLVAVNLTAVPDDRRVAEAGRCVAAADAFAAAVG